MRPIGHLIMKKQLETIRTSVIRSTTMVTNMSSFLIPLCHLVVILLFWRYFGDFGSIAILVISRVFFCQKKFILPIRIHQNVFKDLLIIAKMTKMHYEYPNYPKTLENDQNVPKTTTIPVEALK